jgi:hypothetical protein
VSIVIAVQSGKEEAVAATATATCNPRANGAAAHTEKKKKKIMCLLSFTPVGQYPLSQ